MKLLLIRQAIVIPLGAMLVPILIAFSLPGYSSLSQHISEVALLEHPIALVQRAAALTAGVSILLFSVGLILAPIGIFGFSAFAATLVGASMISNGVVVMGSPLHGLYGLGIFMTLVPAFFATEFSASFGPQPICKVSMAVAVFTLLYFWLMLSGLDPEGFRGLSQRIATVVIFGWYSLAAYFLSIGQRKDGYRLAKG